MRLRVLFSLTCASTLLAVSTGCQLPWERQAEQEDLFGYAAPAADEYDLYAVDSRATDLPEDLAQKDIPKRLSAAQSYFQRVSQRKQSQVSAEQTESSRRTKTVAKPASFKSRRRPVSSEQQTVEDKTPAKKIYHQI